MRPPSRAFGLPGLVLALVLLLPACAWADRYVALGGDPALTECTQALPCTTIDAAITAASPGETVHIGPGGFDGLLYDTKHLHFDGSGAGPVDGPAGAGATVLSGNVILHDPGSISAVRVENQYGIRIDDPAAGTAAVDVSDVVVRAALAGLSGIDSAGGGHLLITVERSAFIQTADGQIYDDFVHAGDVEPLTGDPASLTLTDVTVRAKGASSAVIAAGTLVLNRSSVTAGATATYAVVGRTSTVSLDRTQVHGGHYGIYLDGGSLTLRDSAVVIRGPASPNAYGVIAGAGNGHQTTATFTGSTVVATGANATAAIASFGSVPADDLTLQDTVVVGDPAGVDVIANGAFTTSHAALRKLQTMAGLTPVPTAIGNVTTDPLLSTPAGDAVPEPAAGSPLIDAGDPARPGVGPLDLAGAPRSLDGNGDCTAVLDIGALERAAVANPACSPPPPGPPPGPAADTTAPKVGAASVAGGSGGTAATLTFNLDEPSQVQVTLQSAGGSGAAAVRWRTVVTLLRKRLPAGRQRVRVPRRVHGRRLSRGRYRLRVVATDAAGNTTTKLIAFRLRR